MKTRLFTICLVVFALLATARAYSQECATCNEAAPCNTCVSCCSRPCEVFGGLKNLLACRPCAPVACAPIACEPVVPACDPIVKVRPACAISCAKPACVGVPTCAPLLGHGGFSLKKKHLFRNKCCGGCGLGACSCGVVGGCGCGAIEPACTPVVPACEAVAEFECASVVACGPAFPKVRQVLRRPICSVGKVVGGFLDAVAELTVPVCVPACGGCGLSACNACSPCDVAPACGGCKMISCKVCKPALFKAHRPCGGCGFATCNACSAVPACGAIVAEPACGKIEALPPSPAIL